MESRGERTNTTLAFRFLWYQGRKEEKQSNATVYETDFTRSLRNQKLEFPEWLIILQDFSYRSSLELFAGLLMCWRQSLETLPASRDMKASIKLRSKDLLFFKRRNSATMATLTVPLTFPTNVELECPLSKSDLKCGNK
ncbi:uncharacterized protein LOC130813316 [Amaranthus tricolor]|uniref:uncharacterized protein LOC130813316 n=1 Tax=Amaranthus tricolor TaxID=29722 RepID=UPI00258C6F0D|nr:uncharacterized protein LOC130813316 [Amaranthus tricolor]